MSELITINKLELASELANQKVIDKCNGLVQVFEEDDNGDTHYTETAQELFNEYYDHYLEMIESCKA